jgi:hypothetical protein
MLRTDNVKSYAHVVSVIPEEDFQYTSSDEDESDAEGLFNQPMTEIKLGG